MRERGKTDTDYTREYDDKRSLHGEILGELASLRMNIYIDRKDILFIHTVRTVLYG